MSINEILGRDISFAAGLGPTHLRTAQSGVSPLPAGTTVVSADSHLALAEDIWYENFPARLRDKAPRIWFDEEIGLFHIGVDGKSFYPQQSIPLVRSIEGRPSVRSMDIRMQDLDAEDVAMEIVFPQTVAMFFSWPDYEVREWIFRIYNEYVASLQARYPTRFFPVGVANFWEPSKMAESIRHIRDLGLKTMMLPIKPSKRIDGEQIYYGSEDMDPYWAAAVDAGLPVSIHIGESMDLKGPAATIVEGIFQLGAGAGHFRKIYAEMVFGGAFDRNPDLELVFAEGQMNWVPGLLQDAELARHGFSELLDYTPKRSPSDYWFRHCYATFMNDLVGLRMLDMIGADRVMWSSDYPHNEGTFGYGYSSMQAVLDAAPEADARRILGGNAIQVFKLD